MYNQNKRQTIKGISCVILALLMALTGFAALAEAGSDALPEGFALEQVVVLSRHNIRAPLSAPGSTVDNVTPHSWIQWSSNTSELTVRGGVMETNMGAWFRKWLESEGLFPENYRPDAGEVRFYANAKQRTIATAQYFSSGLLPVANAAIETHVEYDTMDPVFTPQLTFVNDAYRADVKAQIAQMMGAEDVAHVGQGLADAYALLADVIDLKDSPAYAEGTVQGFDTDDTELILELEAEPGMTGSLKLGCQVADALVLQYYEEPDDVKAGFGEAISEAQVREISTVKDTYCDILFTAPLVAVNVAHPLLQEIADELSAEGRRFTFLCGHDSNLASVLAALDCAPYETVGSVEPSIPIGSKLVFEKWRGADGALYARVRLIYAASRQLRNLTLFSDDDPPVCVPIRLEGLDADENGLYAYEDLTARLESAISAYDDLVESYGESLDAAA